MTQRTDPESLAHVLERLEEAIQIAGTQSAFAVKYGLGQAAVSLTRRGLINPPPSLLHTLNLEAVTYYVRLNSRSRR
jgi:hypothetical protein